jgi:hypothetical protein
MSSALHLLNTLARSIRAQRPDPQACVSSEESFLHA